MSYHHMFHSRTFSKDSQNFYEDYPYTLYLNLMTNSLILKAARTLILQFKFEMSYKGLYIFWKSG